jgi:MFS family permease
VQAAIAVVYISAIARRVHCEDFASLPRRDDVVTRRYIRRTGLESRDMSSLVAQASADAQKLLFTRALRGFADGAVSIILASYLSLLGFTPLQIGAIVTSTLLGSAALTLLVGMYGGHWGGRRLLLSATLLMAATGLGFAGVTAFWPLLVIAFVGTLNPSAGDVSVFLPTEQALLAGLQTGRDRTLLFALYNLSGTFAGALGALAAGVPVWLAKQHGWDLRLAQRTAFLAYALTALISAVVYSKLTPSHASHVTTHQRARPLAKSRATVFRLAALFSLDSLGGGFVVQSLLALWLYRRFGLSVESAGRVFFATGLLAAGSQLISPRLAARIGHVRTMVFTHLPANLCLIAAAFMPTANWSIGFLMVRMALSQMDVPARQAYVMAVVPAEERTAAASVTNVPRSLATALTPLLAGLMLEHGALGWPLVCGGATKIVYDLLLLAQFHAVKPLDEA